MRNDIIKSKVPGLDSILGGGLLEESITTVSGSTGSGRSTLGLQFIYNGAMLEDEPGLYITIEESKEDFLFHMRGYNWDIKEAEEEKKLVFLDYPVYEVDQILEGKKAVREIINKVGIKRVVIDSVLPIALYFGNEQTRKKGFLKFIDKIRKWGTTTLITAENDGSKLTELPNTFYGIEDFTDGWINIYYQYDSRKEERRRLIEVIKMKGMSHSRKAYPATIDEYGFKIEHGESIEVEEGELEEGEKIESEKDEEGELEEGEKIESEKDEEEKVLGRRKLDLE